MIRTFGGGNSSVKLALESDAPGEMDMLAIGKPLDGYTEEVPAKFLPANARVSDLAVSSNVVYAATQLECGGNPNALYAIDLSTAEKKVTSFPTNGSGFAGSASVAVATDGSTVYGMIPDGQGSVAGKYSNTVVALGARDLVVKDYFTPSDAAAAVKKGAEVPGATPAVFQWNGMGKLLVDSLRNLDAHLMMGWLLISAAIVILFNLVADLLYGVLDPRIRHA